MNLKVKEICELIKVCGESKVKHLRFETLQVEFLSEAMGAVVSGVELPSDLVGIDESPILKDEIKTRQDQLDMALIESPSEYERLLMSGDLDDEEDDDRRPEQAV